MSTLCAYAKAVIVNASLFLFRNCFCFGFHSNFDSWLFIVHENLLQFVNLLAPLVLVDPSPFFRALPPVCKNRPAIVSFFTSGNFRIPFKTVDALKVTRRHAPPCLPRINEPGRTARWAIDLT